MRLQAALCRIVRPMKTLVSYLLRSNFHENVLGENVGMDDMSTGGHEANRDSVPLISCTDMGVSKDFE